MSCSGYEALGHLMGFEDLSDAHFAGHDSVESIEAQIDQQGTMLLCFHWCHKEISLGWN